MANVLGKGLGPLTHVSADGGTMGNVKLLPFMQALKVKVASGAAAAANIAVTDIEVGDILVGIVALDVEGNASPVLIAESVEDLLSEATVTSDGNIQLDTTSTTGRKLVVMFYDVT